MGIADDFGYDGNGESLPPFEDGDDSERQDILRPAAVVGPSDAESCPLHQSGVLVLVVITDCAQIVPTRIHVHSQSFITYQNHLGIILARFLNAFLFPFYNQQVIYGKIAAHNARVAG